MSSILQEFNLHICAVYIDDVIVFANDFSTCWLYTMIVIYKMTQAGSNISSKKCRFCVSEVKMLGHLFG